MFNIAKSDLKDSSPLKALDEKVINLRLKALLKFGKSFSQCIKYVN